MSLTDPCMDAKSKLSPPVHHDKTREKDGFTEPALIISETYVFPPYIPPPHFHTDASGPGYGSLPPPYGPPNPMPVGATTPARWSPSPSPVRSPVKKRGRGRPKGSRSTHNTRTAAATSAKVAAIKAAAPKQKVKAKQAPMKAKTTASQAQKENVTPPTGADAPIDISDSENEDDGSGYKRWADTDKNKFYRFLLALDAEGERRFTQHQKNPNHVYKRIKSLYTRSMDTFTWMVAFEAFTGNGGGDPDSDDPTAILRSRLEGAHKVGLAIGSLRPDIINTWHDNGWWDLFNDCLGASAKVTREVVRNSASALSDIEDHETAFAPNSDDNINPLLLEESHVARASTALKTPAAQKNPAAIVSEPKHTPATHFRSQATSSFGNISEYVKIKMISEEAKAKAFDAKLVMDQTKLQLEQEKTKAELDKGKGDMVQKVLEMDGASEEVKAAANEFLLSLFK
ncbi:hypothetical protein B0H10DRAFT_1950022 [Mycena sp. CBHHK59/15]|nr:hypothetical protein B0H10DRAFT_1950022 [Mycena sp. CBHHK59/15]